MQRQRGELVPIGDALSDLGGPVKAIREASPQARHHFTQGDQVNQLNSRGQRSGPRISVSWRGCWRSARYPAPTPATGANMSGATALSPWS